MEDDGKGDDGIPVVIHSPRQNHVELTYQPSNPPSQEPKAFQLANVTNSTPPAAPTTTNHPNPTTTDRPNPKAEDLVHQMIKKDSYSTYYWFWIRYVRWWSRWTLVLLTMYWLMVLDNLVTLRHNQTARFYYGGVPKQGEIQVLPDVLFSGYINSTLAANFVNATPALAVVGIILLLVTRRKYAVLAELVWVESIDLFLTALVQIVTGYPDSLSEKNTACWDPAFRSYGSWVWLRVATSFCGNLMWSGHTYHALFCFIMMYRHFYPALLTRINFWVYTLLFWTLFGLWFIAFEICLIGTHFHYTSDVIVAILFTLFLCTNRAILAPGVAFLYPVLRSDEIYIHLLPEAYKPVDDPCGLGQYV